MARKSNTRRTKARKPATQSWSIPYEVKLLLLVAFTIFYSLSIYVSKTGVVGALLKKLTLGFFGFSGFFMPPLIFFIILLIMNPNFKKFRLRMLWGLILLFISFLFFFGLLHYEQIRTLMEGSSILKNTFESGIALDSSGVIGNAMTYLLGKGIGTKGIGVLVIFCSLISLILITRVSFSDVKNDWLKWQEKRQAKARQREQNKRQKPVKEVVQAEEQVWPERAEPVKIHDYSNYFEQEASQERPPGTQAKEIKIIEETKEEKIETPSKEETEKLQGDIEKSLSHKPMPYRKPKLELLNRGEGRVSQGESKKQIQELSDRLEVILRNFGVHARVVEISRGPIVNRFEIEMEPGTKISKVQGLADDLALNLAVSQVRVAPVPGKAAVGIEVPNSENSMVRMREILASREFQDNPTRLKFALGKDISGKTIIADLSKMPHLLIAGTTGSGKSVCVNTIITSILYHATPEEVKLLMIDPKVVELNVYNGIPHLILPVVTDPKKAAIALGWAVNEMTRRYESFAQAGCKDVDSYNQRFPEEKMPKIVVIIDELSDLMMVAPNQVEDAIARLAQMARAAGIHLIVATQRPSVDVITGLIKANIPSRISFAVSSGIDSRTILDMSGAEKLLGRGDMLFHPVGTSRPKRVQGAFISEEEIATVVSFIHGQQIETEYDESILDRQVSNVENDFEDELLEDAIALVLEMKSASASMLQRKFRIGYNRAGRLIDMMADRGIVGPPQGSKPREVLVDYYEAGDASDS